MKSEWHKRWCLLLARTANVGVLEASGGCISIGASIDAEASLIGSVVDLWASDTSSADANGVSIPSAGGGSGGGASAEAVEDSRGKSA